MDGKLPSYHLLQLLELQEGVNKMLAFLNQAEVINVSFRFRCPVQKTSAFTAFLYRRHWSDWLCLVQSVDGGSREATAEILRTTDSRKPTAQTFALSEWQEALWSVSNISFGKVSNEQRVLRVCVQSHLHRQKWGILNRFENVRPTAAEFKDWHEEHPHQNSVRKWMCREASMPKMDTSSRNSVNSQ